MLIAKQDRIYTQATDSRRQKLASRRRARRPRHGRWRARRRARRRRRSSSGGRAAAPRRRLRVGVQPRARRLQIDLGGALGGARHDGARAEAREVGGRGDHVARDGHRVGGGAAGLGAVPFDCFVLSVCFDGGVFAERVRVGGEWVRGATRNRGKTGQRKRCWPISLLPLSLSLSPSTISPLLTCSRCTAQPRPPSAPAPRAPRPRARRTPARTRRGQQRRPS